MSDKKITVIGCGTGFAIAKVNEWLITHHQGGNSVIEFDIDNLLSIEALG